MNYTFQQLVNEFINGATTGISGSGGNLKIIENKLIHYKTVIAERYIDKFLVNVTRYSIQTGRLQKILKNTISNDLIIEVRQVPKNYSDSLIAIK